MTSPKSLIINKPYERPRRHWIQGHGGTLSQVETRREAGYEIFDIRNNTRRTESLDLVNAIRTRVDTWRTADYPGITSVTRTLLEHWHDKSARDYPFYFCQLEAIETLIWWVPDVPEKLITSAATFKSNFPFELTVVPVRYNPFRCQNHRFDPPRRDPI